MRHRILLIEPSEPRRRALTEALSSRGLDVAAMASGRAGVQRLEQYLPSVLVTALFIEEVDGLEVTHLSCSLSPDTRVVVVDDRSSGVQQNVDYLDVARQVGAAVCLRCPSVTQIVEAVEGLLPRAGEKNAS